MFKVEWIWEFEFAQNVKDNQVQMQWKVETIQDIVKISYIRLVSAIIIHIALAVTANSPLV